ncbi:hypothetical protein RJT34_08315 [Clitoria ternatea]|uniref:Pentatricopeptide repeat-containing protein n=1 Tax=Clitoria ternatea TaxID=43366 RepID=A0AAN9K6W3_CLITE
MYSRCGQIGLACKVFNEIPIRNVVAWTVLVIGYVHNGENQKSLESLYEMHRIGEDNQKPNSRTFEGGFLACGNMGSLSEGKCLHGLVMKNGIGCSQVIHSSLLSMYTKCGAPKDAYSSFSEVINRDLLSWTSIISVYTRFGMVECVRFFWEMLDEQIYPDGIVIACILSSFGNSMNLYKGKAFHGLIIWKHYVPDEKVNNSLLFIYCKFGMLSFAERLFHVCRGNEECWNFMVYGYDRTGNKMKCIKLFREMKVSGIHSESISIISAIASCSRLGAIDLGRSEKDVILWNTLMSSHIHVKHHEEATDLFDKMVIEGHRPNTATFVIVLSACAHMASLEKGERIFQHLEESNMKPNEITFLFLLSVCVHVGLVEEGKFVFSKMLSYSVKPNLKHYTCMVDLLGRSGNLQEAKDLVLSMPISPDGSVWAALLGHCKTYNQTEMGIRIAMHAISSEPEKDGYYITMANMYSSTGRWEKQKV